MRLLITGGCGFIGSNFVRFVLEHYQPEFVTNFDGRSVSQAAKGPLGIDGEIGGGEIFGDRRWGDRRRYRRL